MFDCVITLPAATTAGYFSNMKEFLLLMGLMSGSCASAQPTHAVVMDELMADPTPVAVLHGGLPEAEFIELKNVSTMPVNLNGWTIQDNSSTATVRTNFVLQPDSFVVLCSTASLARFTPFGSALGLANFPSLDNDGELLSLRSKDGKLVHALLYSKSWYRNAVKSEGGWSLEMTDPNNPCGANNWQASTAAIGGSPGKINAVNGINKDVMPPRVQRAYAADASHISLFFDEPLDSLQASTASAFTISNGIGPAISASPVAPLFTEVLLTLGSELQDEKIYQVSVKDLADCSGNRMVPVNDVRAALGRPSGPGDVVINEIMFNPVGDGADYIEFYNRSRKTVSLKQLFLTNRASGGTLNPPKQCTPYDYPLFPGDYVALTERSTNVKNFYNPKQPDAIIEVNALPSMPDDRGSAVILNEQGVVIDELRYDAHWQFKLIDDPSGVALERIDFDKPTQDAGNWHSAATSYGYGTPGYQNSQYKADAMADAAISLGPAVFSPDNDGRDDFVTITYHFPEQGYVCNLTIFDSNGRPVRFLTRNAICGIQGYFRWDGLNEKNSALNMGVYVLIADIFNLKGNTKKFKLPVILARKLQ